MISVIVPVYNVAAYLDQCIESICRQTYRDLEIILVDDGSTDDSGRICDFYAAGDSRILVIHKENGGLVSARKAGMTAAHGSYIAYVDGDDWIEETMYEKLMHCLTRMDVDVAMCGRYEDTGDFSKAVFQGIKQGKYDKKRMTELIYPNMIVNGKFFNWGIFPGVWDKLFKREYIEPFQMEVDERICMGEDAVCVYPCLLHVESIYILEECLYHYRQTASSMIKKSESGDLERERFFVMYQEGKRKFTLYQNIYDCRKQWEMYALFLMTPRADCLYRGFSKLDFLFPFPKVKKGMRIALYGAGTYGQRLYGYLRRTGFCEVAIWVDRNFLELQKSGLEVMPPDAIQADEVDQIVVSVMFERPRKELYQKLTEKYGRDKVSVPDENRMFSSEAKRAFGMEDDFACHS